MITVRKGDIVVPFTSMKGRFKNTVRMVKVDNDIVTILGEEKHTLVEIRDLLAAKGIKHNLHRELYRMKNQGTLNMESEYVGTKNLKWVYSVVRSAPRFRRDND